MSDLTTLRQSYLERISGAADGDALEAVRLAALGKKGEISGMMKELGRMSPEERQTRGAELNRLRDEIDGLSIGYRTISAERDGKGRRLLTEVELWEVSLVTFPMLAEAKVGKKSDRSLEMAAAFRAATMALRAE